MTAIYFVTVIQTKTVNLIPSVSKVRSFCFARKPHGIRLFSDMATKSDTRPRGYPGRVLFVCAVFAVPMPGVIAETLVSVKFMGLLLKLWVSFKM